MKKVNIVLVMVLLISCTLLMVYGKADASNAGNYIPSSSDSVTGARTASGEGHIPMRERMGIVGSTSLAHSGETHTRPY